MAHGGTGGSTPMAQPARPCRVVVLTVSGEGIARGGLDTYVAALQQAAALRRCGPVRFHAIPPDPRYLRDPGHDPALGRLLAEAEVIHANDAFAGEAALLRKGERARLVTAFHLLGSAYYRPHAGTGFASAMTEAERRVVAGSDRLIAVSHAMARDLRRLGAPPERIEVIPNGTDPRFHEAAREAPGGPLRLLFCGRLVPQKGAQHLPALLRGLAAQPWPWRLDVVGEGPLEGPLQQAVRRIGVARRVHFAGWRPHAEMPARYAAADATLSLTRYEPFGLFALESIAAGTPVVGAVVDGMQEFCRPAANALPVAPGPGLAGRLLHALDRLRRGGGRFAPATLRESVASFTWERTAERLAAVYARP